MNHSFRLVSEWLSELDSTNHQGDAFVEGLAGTSRSELHNPILPAEFDLFDPAPAAKHRWEFANGNPASLTKAIERPGPVGARF